MKVTKIDIKKEVMDVRPGSPYIKFSVKDLLRAMVVNQEDITPQMTTIDEVTYYIRQVFNPETLQKDLYAVKQDEDGMFRDLVAVSMGYIEQRIEKARERWLEDMLYRDIPEAKAQEVKRIKNLPFWKRLFNSF